MKKISEFLSENFQFLSENFQFFGGEIFNILDRRVFIMELHVLNILTDRLILLFIDLSLYKYLDVYAKNIRYFLCFCLIET